MTYGAHGPPSGQLASRPVAKPAKKIASKLDARRKQYDSALSSKSGFHRPGSRKKT